MKRNNWEVTEDSIRPAGEIDRCFYCRENVGAQHKTDCPIRSRTVLAKVSFEVLLEVPEFWDKGNIEFFYSGEGSHCASNILDILGEQDERTGCLCGVVETEYIREATQEDEQEFKMYVKDFES